MSFPKERWMMTLFALVVSAIVVKPGPWKRVWDTSGFQSLFARWVELRWPLSIILLIGFFPALEALVLLVALGLYLGATRSFTLRGFLTGSAAAVLVLSFGKLLAAGSPPTLFYNYVILRLPLLIGVVLGICAARATGPGALGPPQPRMAARRAATFSSPSDSI
jgi:hypothetical protein